MHILIFSQHYPPETVGTAKRAYDMCTGLRGEGVDVTVVTGYPNHPNSVAQGLRNNRLPRKQVLDGVTVLRVPVFSSASRRTLIRMLNYGSFTVSSFFRSLLVRRVDLIIAISPLPTAVGGYLRSLAYGTPLIYDVCDIWPDFAVDLNVLKEGTLLRLFRLVEGSVLRRARQVCVVSPGYIPNLTAKGVPSDKLRVIRDWVDTSLFSPERYNRLEARRQLGLGVGETLFTYIGTVGLAQGLEALIRAAGRLQEDSSIRFLIVGDGPDREALKQQVDVMKLANVEFRDSVAFSEVPLYHAAADVLVASYQKTGISEIAIPSKLYEYMASGRPILHIAGGVSAEMLAAAQSGICATPGDVGMIAESVRRLAGDIALREALGNSGRQFAETYCRKERILREFTEGLQHVLLPLPRGSVPSKVTPGVEEWKR